MSKIQDFVEKIILFFNRNKQTLNASVLNPPTWRERQIQNQLIEKQYEESVKAQADIAHWSDKYYR